MVSIILVSQSLCINRAAPTTAFKVYSATPYLVLARCAGKGGTVLYHWESFDLSTGGFFFAESHLQVLDAF